MKVKLVVLLLSTQLLMSGAADCVRADEPAVASSRSAAPVPAKRTQWTKSRVVGSPEPPLPYDVERVFPKLTFNMPVDLVSMPGSDRMFVVEQNGKVLSFVNQSDVATSELVLDAAKDLPGVKQTYSLAFHPRFAENRYCYLCCIRDAEQPDGTRILRFQVSESDPPTIEPKSEQVVITFLSGGHNGCCLKFGPDGYLYISTGDGAGPNPPDTLKTGQDCSDLLSSILRIDVDHADEGRNYRIPPDNPFPSLAGTRPEIWAFGLRNPWRMSFDSKSGDLWVGDVGWELWELLIRVERGGNYGWSVVEGRQSTHPDWPRGPSPILPPTIEHPHSESSSITAGVSYDGTRLPELAGSFIYGDYDTGKIWSLRTDGKGVPKPREIADTTLRIVNFNVDSSGEMYLLHHIGGSVHRLVPNPQSSEPSAFPQQLSETGLFTSLPALTPSAGVVPYQINAEPWEDGALAERHVALPGESRIKPVEPVWQFPKDTVLAKTLSLNSGENSAKRRVETQLLHYTGTEWKAYTYAWNAEQTDAALVEAAGADATIDVGDGTGSRKQRWHFASRAECLRCHNPWSGSALAFQTHQLHRMSGEPGEHRSQIDEFFRLGLFETPVPADKRPQLAEPGNDVVKLDDRARAYLHTNCAHCHRMHAGSAVLTKLQFDLPLAETSLIGERPSLGTFGISSAEVVAPGDPARSVLFYRMAKLGSGHMPHIGAQQVDEAGLQLIHDWIESLPPKSGSAPSPSDAAVARRAEEQRLLGDLKTDGPNGTSSRAEVINRLLSTTSGALSLMRAVDRRSISAEGIAIAVEKGSGHEQVAVRDLFERFLPEEKRAKRLGTVVRADEILKLNGDAAQGRRLFFETEGVQCRN
ncbi:MAG: PQQ-dependent sugar dehydrogenase, partial [Planctomycetaceae bacterium]